MRSEQWLGGFRWGTVAGAVGVACVIVLVLSLTSCARTLVPSGKPGCPNATVWSDSAQRCIAREGR